MKSWKFMQLTSRAIAGLLTVSALTAAVQADDSEGVVRIQRGTDSPVQAVRHDDEAVIRAQNCPPQNCRTCRPSDYYFNHPLQAIHDCPTKQAFDGWLAGQATMHRARTQYASMQMRSEFEADCREKALWARCKFGYFLPSGCCGKGCPPIGHYSMVYPVNPAHADGRDGQVYAAQGYGGPVAMPLAPNVGHTYNYGWGIPSSRLTPISHPVSPQQAHAYQGQPVQAVPVQP